jgi:hypothetical protein
MNINVRTPPIGTGTLLVWIKFVFVVRRRTASKTLRRRGLVLLATIIRHQGWCYLHPGIVMSTTKRVKGAEPSENADADHDETFAKRLRKVPPSTSAAVAASTPNKSGKAISNAKKNATTTATSSTKASAGGVVHEIDHAWTYMFYQLMLYRAEHGDFNVPPKATEHKKLCDWIKEQRRQFKLYQETHHPSSTTLLTEEQVLVLESVQFPLTTRGDDHWKRNLENLKKFKEEHGVRIMHAICSMASL